MLKLKEKLVELVSEDTMEMDNKEMQFVERFRDYYNMLDEESRGNHLEVLNNFIDKEVESERIRKFMKEVALIVDEHAEELGLRKSS